MKTALITGVTGQDGAYLSQFLLDKNYRVIGLQQPSATPNTQNIHHLIEAENFELIVCDITDANAIFEILKTTNPDEIYNLAGQSHVGLSFNLHDYTTQVNAIGTLRLLEAIRILDLKNTPLKPASPYAVAKTYAHNIVKVYRDSYDIHASCGILFNHESPIRGEKFVTRKITKVVAQIHKGEQEILTLGNLDAMRDWGHARDYVLGMWLMLQQKTPDDYVLATEEKHSVRDFVERCFSHVGITIKWQESGLDEIGINQDNGKTLINISSEFYRPNDVHALCGDATKAKDILGWKPEISFDDLITEMMDAEINA